MYGWVTGLTLVAALYDLFRTLPETAQTVLHLGGVIDGMGAILPLSGLGLGWICPAVLGLVIGLICHAAKRGKAAA